MHKYSAVIIDDERLARVSLKKKLENIKEIAVIDEAANIKEAIKSINKHNPDLLFLDIQLAEGNGFDLLNKIDYNGKVVFVTAFDEYALRAFELNALDYIMKPVSEKRLEEVIQRLEKYSGGPEKNLHLNFNLDDRIMVPKRDSFRFIKIDSILFIEATGDYTTIHTANNNKYLVNRSMREWEKRLPQRFFYRIHRSYIVFVDAIERLQKLSPNTVNLYIKDVKFALKVGRNYYKNLKKKYG